MVIFDTSGDAKKIQDIFEITRDEINDAAETFGDEDLLSAASYSVTREKMQMDYVTSRVDKMIFELIEFGVCRGEEDLDTVLAGLSAEVVRQQAQTLLSGPATLSAYGPVRRLPKL